MHVEGAALRILQLQPAWRQRGRLLAEQGSCTAEAASRALCTDHQMQCQLRVMLFLGGLVAPSGLVCNSSTLPAASAFTASEESPELPASEHEEVILCPKSCKTQYM